ncbi:MAG: sigma-70 family RNA polymerase sigma factor [Chloroflexi bacterium]|nr:sigma-70 family RNA polymerase sigma factor [Chloroflexota bacterium]
MAILPQPGYPGVACSVIVCARGEAAPAPGRQEPGGHVQDIEALAREAQKGDDGAFAQIYELFFDRIHRYLVVRIGDPAEAEDLTQEVFLRAMEGLGGYRWQGKPFAAWLFRIAHNLMVDRFRRRERAGPSVPLESALDLPAQEDVAGRAVVNMDVQHLQGALARLTELQRQAVLLRFIAGLSLEETAQVMGKNENAIKALQHAALQSLRRLLLPALRDPMAGKE